MNSASYSQCLFISSFFVTHRFSSAATDKKGLNQEPNFNKIIDKMSPTLSQVSITPALSP